MSTCVFCLSSSNVCAFDLPTHATGKAALPSEYPKLSTFASSHVQIFHLSELKTIEDLKIVRQQIVDQLKGTAGTRSDEFLCNLNMSLCNAIMHLYKETERNEASIEAMEKKVLGKLDDLEGMTEDHKNILKWHHQALHSVTMQAKLLEMIALGVGLIYELLYFY